MQWYLLHTEMAEFQVFTSARVAGRLASINTSVIRWSSNTLCFSDAVTPALANDNVSMASSMGVSTDCVFWLAVAAMAVWYTGGKCKIKSSANSSEQICQERRHVSSQNLQ